MKELTHNDIHHIESLLQTFFPDSRIDEKIKSYLTTKNNEKIIYSTEEILPYLQTIFFEEHVVELQIDHSTRLYSANLLDESPLLNNKEENIESDIIDPEYEQGSYLKKMDVLIFTPLTPGIGNAAIRSSKHIILRFYTGTVAIELGCSFYKQDNIQGIPVLRLNFPIIGRVNNHYRPYRVKTISTVEAQACITEHCSSGSTDACYDIVDISTRGLAFQIQSEESPYKVGEPINFAIRVKGKSELIVCGKVRRVTKVRNKQGYKNIYGIQFDLETRALAAQIEQLTSAIQRLHLRELSEKMSDLRGVKLVR